jgi:hypothetical protein
MSTHQFMRSEYPALGQGAPAKTAAAPKTRGPLEWALIGASVVAWSWCAYEVVLLFIS